MGLNLRAFKWDPSEVASTAMQGFSLERNLFPFLEKAAMEGGTPAEFTVVPKKNISEFKAEKWQHLTRELFTEKTLKGFNEEVALRHGLDYDGDGRVMWREKYLMYMQKDYRAALMQYRSETAERETQDRLKVKIRETKELDRVAKDGTELIGHDPALKVVQGPARLLGGTD
jgi:hypothetical protein